MCVPTPWRALSETLWQLSATPEAAPLKGPSDLGAGTAAEIEEERRLLYVAMTRAKDDFHLVDATREPMTLGNMRALGVGTLGLTWKLCHHEAVLPADAVREARRSGAYRIEACRPHGPRSALMRFFCQRSQWIPWNRSERRGRLSGFLAYSCRPSASFSRGCFLVALSPCRLLAFSLRYRLARIPARAARSHEHGRSQLLSPGVLRG